MATPPREVDKRAREVATREHHTPGVGGGSFRDVLRGATDVALKPFRTAAGLVTRPAALFRAYRDRTADDILGPGKFALLGMGLYLASKAFLSSPMESIFNPVVWAARGPDLFRSLFLYAAPVLLLPISTLQRRLFRRYDRSWRETFDFGLYMIGAIAIFKSVLVVVSATTGLLDVHSSTTEHIRNGIIFAIEALFIAHAATGFYRDRRMSVWLRGALAYTVYYLVGYGILAAVLWYSLRGLFG